MFGLDLMDPSEIHERLWLGGSRWRYPDDFHVDLLVTLCEERERWYTPEAGRELCLPMADRTTDGATLEQIQALVDEILTAHGAGQTVLIRCHWGIERSGMVAALVMRRLTGLPFTTVLAAMRRARSPQLLFDPHASAYKIASA